MRKTHTKATTVDGAVHAMQNVLAAPLPSPHPLSKRQKPIWDEILLRRSRDEWQPVDLRFAWELTQVMVRLQDEETQLLQEGSIIEGKAGAKMNPRDSIVQSLSRRAMSLARHLRIHPASDADHPDRVTSGRQAEKQARATVSSSPTDSRRNILPMN
jgi:hypothetical protein